jgi:ketosteroid isomerase-like protein
MSPATTGSQDAARQIRALDTEFMRLANAKDAAALTKAFYAEDARLMPPNAPMVKGHAAIQDFWTAFMKVTGTDVTLETSDIEAAGDLAYGVGRWKGTLQGTKQQGKYIVVYRRQGDGGYKAIADIFNADA